MAPDNYTMSKRLVIVPTYNEIENIDRIIDAVMQLPLDTDLLIVDDNSPDGTGIVADQLADSFL